MQSLFLNLKVTSFGSYYRHRTLFDVDEILIQNRFRENHQIHSICARERESEFPPLNISAISIRRTSPLFWLIHKLFAVNTSMAHEILRIYRMPSTQIIIITIYCIGVFWEDSAQKLALNKPDKLSTPHVEWRPSNEPQLNYVSFQLKRLC